MIWSGRIELYGPFRYNLGCLLADEGDLSAAEAVCKAVVAAQALALGPGHPESMRTRAGLSELVGSGELICRKIFPNMFEQHVRCGRCRAWSNHQMRRRVHRAPGPSASRRPARHPPARAAAVRPPAASRVSVSPADGSGWLFGARERRLISHRRPRRCDQLRPTRRRLQMPSKEGTRRWAATTAAGEDVSLGSDRAMPYALAAAGCDGLCGVSGTADGGEFSARVAHLHLW